MFFIKAVNNAINNYIKKKEKVLLIKELNKLYNKKYKNIPLLKVIFFYYKNFLILK